MSECICGQPAVQFHHVVYQQHVRRAFRGQHPSNTTPEYAECIKKLLSDRRNMLPLCYDCHRRHHNRVAPISRSDLPDAAVLYAEELLGDYADDYLRRYYQ